MQRLLSKIAKNIKDLYTKAEDLIEEERDIPLSQNLLNAILQKYVTDKVSALQDLHADVYDDWSRLYATIDYKGMYAVLSVDLRLIQMIIDQEVQHLVFEQISQTQVISVTFDSALKKIAFNMAVYVCQRMLNKDPLGPILEKLKVAEVKYGLVHIDLNKYFLKSERAMRQLKKFKVSQGAFRDATVVVKGNINLHSILYADKESESDVIEDVDFTEINSIDPAK